VLGLSPRFNIERLVIAIEWQLDEECGENLTWLRARVKKCAFLINTYQEAGNNSA